MKKDVTSEPVSAEKELALESIISSAVQLSGVKVDRKKFLRELPYSRYLGLRTYHCRRVTR